MKAIILAVLAIAFSAISNPAEAIVKCPQPDGSVLSVPESVGCSTEFERAQQRADQATSSQRRQAERAAEAAEREAEARQQQGADFVRASQACTQQANRHKFYDDPNFKSVANADGTVRMLGTAKDRFDYQTCMEQRGHRLDSK
jgi:hypothetical protein